MEFNSRKVEYNLNIIASKKLHKRITMYIGNLHATLMQDKHIRYKATDLGDGMISFKYYSIKNALECTGCININDGTMDISIYVPYIGSRNFNNELIAGKYIARIKPEYNLLKIRNRIEEKRNND